MNMWLKKHLDFTPEHLEDNYSIKNGMLSVDDVLNLMKKEENASQMGYSDISTTKRYYCRNNKSKETNRADIERGLSVI